MKTWKTWNSRNFKNTAKLAWSCWYLPWDPFKVTWPGGATKPCHVFNRRHRWPETCGNEETPFWVANHGSAASHQYFITREACLWEWTIVILRRPVGHSSCDGSVEPSLERNTATMPLDGCSETGNFWNHWHPQNSRISLVTHNPPILASFCRISQNSQNFSKSVDRFAGK